MDLGQEKTDIWFDESRFCLFVKMFADVLTEDFIKFLRKTVYKMWPKIEYCNGAVSVILS